MSFYVIFTALIGFIVLFKIKHKGLGLLLLLVLFFLSAFRGENVGHDTLNYMDADYIKHRGTALMDFRYFEISDFGSQVEIINNSLCKIVYDLQLEPRWLLVFYSFIMLMFLCLAAREFKLPLTLLLSFYVLQGLYFESFNVARQFAAISVILYAVSFSQHTDRSKNKFFLWLAVASLIHSFSVVCFFLYFLFRIQKIPHPLITFSYLSCLLLVVLKFDVISNISVLLSSDKITSYLDNYGESGGLNIIGILYNWIYISVLYYFYYIYNKKCVVNNTLSVLYIFSLIIYSAVVNYGGIIGRIHFNFSVIQLVILTSLFSKNIKPLSFFDKCVFFIYMFIACYGASRKGYMLESDYYMCL